MEENTMQIDWTLYGAKCRKKRQDMGFRTAEAFAAEVFRRTRTHLTRDILYKIEQGRQEPSALEFIGLNLSLWGDPFPVIALYECLSPELARVLSAYEARQDKEKGELYYAHSEIRPWVPNSWRVDNARDAIELDEVRELERLIDNVTGNERHVHRAEEIAQALHTTPELFADIPVIPPKPDEGE